MKNTIKRFISALLAAMLPAAALCAPAAFAASAEFEIITDKTELTREDDTLAVTVNVEALQPIRGIQGTVAYNKDVLTAESFDKGDVIFNGLAGDVTSDEEGKINFSVVYAEPAVLTGEVCSAVFRLNTGTGLDISEVRVKNIKIVNDDGENEEPGDVYQRFDIDLANTGASPTEKPQNSGGHGTGGGHTSGTAVPAASPKPSAEPEATKEPDNGKTDTEEPSPKPDGAVFADTETHWAREDIEFLYGLGIVSGVTEDTFEPDRSITRAEFTKLVSELAELNVAMPNVFSDVARDAWYRQYVMLAYTAGFVTGDGDTFRPNDNMTRAELAVIAERVCGYFGAEQETKDNIMFDDDADIPSWAKDGVYKAAARGIVKGDQNRFDPNGLTTRAQASAVIRRIYDLKNNI